MRSAWWFVVAILALGPGGTTPSHAAEAEGAAPRLSDELRVRFTSALTTLRSGDPSAAARELGDAEWAATPLREYALLFQAEALVRARNLAGARAAATRAVEGAPDGAPAPPVLLRAAAVLAGAGDDAGAAALYRRFLDHHGDRPEAPAARYAMARSLLAIGRVAEAAQAWTELWVQAPASPQGDDAARQLRVLEDRGLGGAAVTQRDRVERAERLLAAGRADAARSAAEALREGGGLPADISARALKVVVLAARREGQYDAALAAVSRAIGEVAPGKRAPWLLELARLQQRRSPDTAIATLDKLVTEYPKSPEAAEALGQKARQLEGASRFAEADTVYAKLVAEHPDQDEAATALWRLGWLAWFRGAYVDAAAFWQRSASARGGQANREAAQYWAARAHQQRGDGELAARQLAQIRADAPRSYYGILAAKRGGTAIATPPSGPVQTLPEDAREPLLGDPRFATAEALRSVGVVDLAEEEMGELTRRSLGEPKRLYAISAAYAQEKRYHLSLRILRRHFVPLARSGQAGLPREFWEMFYPLGWRPELTEAASRSSIDPLLVAAVVREESSYNAQARSPVGARGLMQLMPETARPMARARGLAFNDGDVLEDPAANLDMGSAFLSGLMREFGDARLAAAAYNAGPARVREWWSARRSDDLEVFVEQIPFNETRGFVKRVMLSWDEYRRLYLAAVSGESPATTPSSSERPWPN